MVHPVSSQTHSLADLGYLLQQLEIIQPEQWSITLSNQTSLTNLLQLLEQLPAWWNPSCPAISPYQRDCISRRYGQGFRDLDRDLRVNGYLIIDKVGEGGTAVVHKAWSLELGQIVAVKRLVLSRQTLRDRLEREARILNLLDDSRITQYVAYEGVEDGSGHLLAMEYIDGKTLRDLLRAKGRLTVEQAVFWTSELLEALDHAHRRGVVHRDVTPRNIMFHHSEGSEVPQVKLLDFGLGKVNKGARISVPEIEVHQDLTGKSQAIGTFQYMSPEQYRDTASVTGAADIYSLGCAFYEMLAGRPPFNDIQFSALCMKHSSEEPANIRTWCPEAPDCVVDALSRMLSKKPDRRQDAARIRAILLGRTSTQLGDSAEISRKRSDGSPSSDDDSVVSSAMNRSGEIRWSTMDSQVAKPLEHPVNHWLSILFQASPFVKSARFIDPVPTPSDIVRSVRKFVLFGLVACVVLWLLRFMFR
jgi:serine/threonine protein kinase